ncbi:hypothetical protein, partial [Escherichia coli]|uniref:hypothetical protein n=1 Tax=Escherichia coli TaxID=562 RepID=UPI00384FDD06
TVCVFTYVFLYYFCFTTTAPPRRLNPNIRRQQKMGIKTNHICATKAKRYNGPLSNWRKTAMPIKNAPPIE